MSAIMTSSQPWLQAEAHHLCHPLRADLLAEGAAQSRGQGQAETHLVAVLSSQLLELGQGLGPACGGRWPCCAFR